VTRLISLLFHDVYIAKPAESGFEGEGAARYKQPVTLFAAQLAKLAAVLPQPPLLITESIAAAGPMPVAITVDDGGVSYHSIVAGLLEEQGWRGHCFVTTGWIGRQGFLHKRQIRELHSRGHLIGSHSVTHPARFSACSRTEMRQEWYDSVQMLQDILGAEVHCASVPGGYYSRDVAHTAAEAGITTLFTSEPEIQVRSVDGCRVIGRYAIRRGDAPDYPTRLAARSSSARHTAWLKWNGKKVLKAALGADYPGLATRFARLERGAGSPHGN
jgi:peptidoglycan/xylan/chitin deacetylase (PgdA/CDA1 family)